MQCLDLHLQVLLRIFGLEGEVVMGTGFQFHGIGGSPLPRGILDAVDFAESSK